MEALFPQQTASNRLDVIRASMLRCVRRVSLDEQYAAAEHGFRLLLSSPEDDDV